MTQPLELALDALYQIILPIFLVLGVGYLAGRKLLVIGAPNAAVNHGPQQQRANESSLRTLSKLVFYVFSPALAFTSLATSDLGTREIARIGAFALVTTLSMGLIAWVLARMLRLAPAETGSLLLVAMFANAGNYGLPLNELAYGPMALDRAVIYFVCSSILLFSLGVVVAARAQGKTRAQLLTRVLYAPVVHAVWLAALVRLGVLSVPAPILKAASLVAQGTVPLMLLILGIQLSHVKMHGNWRLVNVATGVRMLLAPLLAVPLATLMGLSGLAEQVAVTEASMPSAVYTIILAVEFELALDLTSSVVLITTLISPLTLVALITYLR